MGVYILIQEGGKVGRGRDDDVIWLGMWCVWAGGSMRHGGVAVQREWRGKRTGRRRGHEGRLMKL